MNVVAVIPARAGSKGIPNKNIRLINGKPMIYYSIKNAINSKYINKVIVSTDSQEIIAICKQMNVDFIDRKKELCGDAITLDSVIHNAVEKISCDYVVTLQPTSPTLCVETLDAAIKFVIDQEYDTVISVINRPHLSWKMENDEVVPNYKERLNRQFLPPNYMETGAFVISRRSVVTENTRIGKKIGVFEISENEAIDIDSFSDFLVAKNILSGNKKIAFYVNGSNKIGLGHIYRVLELADEFLCKPDIYFNQNITNKEMFGVTTHNLIAVESDDDFIKKCHEIKYDIIINGILSTSGTYMKRLRKSSPLAKIVNFEDSGVGSRYADVVFNALLNDVSQKNVYSGELYYIVSKLFMFYNPIAIKEKVKKILITFGGADPRNYTDRLLAIVAKPKYKKYKFIFVLGRAKENYQQLIDSAKPYHNIEIYYDIKNMPELMSSVDLAVTSRGRTGYELATLGVPTIAMAQNNREELHEFVCTDNGFFYLGNNPNDDMIESALDSYLTSTKAYRQKCQNMMKEHDLKKGRERILNIINNL